MHIKHDLSDPDNWILPHNAEVLDRAGLKTIEQYIDKRRNTLWMNAMNLRRILSDCLQITKPKKNSCLS